MDTAQYSVTMGSLTARFTSASALEDSRSESKYNDGSTNVQLTHLGFRTISNVTVSKPYVPAADVELVQAYKNAYETGEIQTLAIQAVDASTAGNPIPGSKTLMLTGCQVQRIAFPPVDRNGSGVSMIEISVTVGDHTYQ